MASDGNGVEVAGAARTEFVQLEQRIVAVEVEARAAEAEPPGSVGRIYNFLLPLRHPPGTNDSPLGCSSESNQGSLGIRAFCPCPSVGGICLSCPSRTERGMGGGVKGGGLRLRVRSPVNRVAGIGMRYKAGQTRAARRADLHVERTIFGRIYCSRRLLRLSSHHPLAAC